MDQAYIREIESWQQQREAGLMQPHGWLSTAGLFWLEEGENQMGAGEAYPVRIPARFGSVLSGVFTKEGNRISLTAQAGIEILYQGDPVRTIVLSIQDGSSEAISLGDLRIFVLERGERYGVRIFDPQHPARQNFRGLSWFPIDLRFRIEARFSSFSNPKTIEIINVLGDIELMKHPGWIEFELEGQLHRLDPVEREDGRLWFLFRDLTNGETTYPAGRYLVSEPPAEGKVLVDFNKAYNPPCAFTEFATCPLPPPGNRLPFRVPAGELKNDY